MAVTGILETTAYYDQYKEADPWVAKHNSSDYGEPNLAKRTSSRTEDGKISVPKNATPTGKEFLTYLKNRFGIQKLRCQFSEENLYAVINGFQNGAGPILAYIHNSGWEQEDKIVKSVLNTEDFSNLVVDNVFSQNSCFQSIGILSNCQDIAILKPHYDRSKGSAFVMFKVVSGRPNSVEVIYLEPLRLTEINPDSLEQKLSKYLSSKDTDQQPQPQPSIHQLQPSIPKQVAPRKASASGYSDPQDIRDEQELAYQRMIAEENLKHEAKRRQEEEEKMAELTLQKKMISMQRRERLKKETYISNLPAEPTQGNIIKIALRLPDGSRLQRNFSKADPVEVVFSQVVCFRVRLFPS